MQSLTTNHPEILEVLSTEVEVEQVIGKPSSKVLAKVVNKLDDICRAFIARSPFVLVASSDASGNLDVSPKGDPAGFVHVLDDRSLVLLMQYLDTVWDFVGYLRKRESLILSGRLKTAQGEEALLGRYVGHLNAAGEHDFGFPESQLDIFLGAARWQHFRAA